MKKKNILSITICCITLFSISCKSTSSSEKSKVKTESTSNSKPLQATQLFVELPDYCPTPDAFDVSPDGILTLSCPNYADSSIDGVIIQIMKDGTISKLASLPPAKNSNKAGNPMGIAYAPDGSLFVCDNQGKNKGRIFRLTFKNGKIENTEVVAYGLNGPNGIRYYKGFVYVTLPILSNFKTEKVTSGVYRFNTSDRNIKVNNDSTDVNLIFTTQTQNPKKQFGLDGLTFDNNGNLLVGNLGDGTILKLTLTEEGNVSNQEIYASLPDSAGIDGIYMSETGTLYAAGFAKNQLWKVTKDRQTHLIAEYGDNNGANGELDQPADLFIYDNKLLISNFDLMTEAFMTNRSHGKPYTVSYIELDKLQ